MLVIREVMNCKPGKVRPLVEKFLAMSKIMEKGPMGKMRIMTDLSGVRYWTLVAEMQVENMAKFESMMAGEGMSESDNKQFEELMKGYHDLVDEGRREVYKLEG